MPAPRLGPGVLLDGFTLGPLIHGGGMARLWEASREGTPGPLLMKVPVLAEGSDPAALVSFEMEQMILPRLSGPHVPRYVACGDFGLQPYLVMERIPGTSLLARLPDLPLAPVEVASLGARIADALDDLHRQGVVHLDVKPSNVLFRPGGEAVLVDYGLSRHEELPDLMGEQFRLPYGTAPYMAPEQVLGQRRDPRSDQFALGVLLYFFVTGVRPFGDPQRLSGLKRRLWRDPVPPRKLRPDCPPWLQEIILRCLEVRPPWRYPTAAQLAFELRHPGQVRLTARSERLRRDAFTTVLRRRFAEDLAAPPPDRAVRIGADAPIVAVALDLAEAEPLLGDALRDHVARILDTLPGARVACLNVLKQGRLTLDTSLDEEGRSKALQRLVELQHWAGPLKLEEGRVSFHVLESPQPAAELLRYARANGVDHLVLGARAKSLRRTLLGSVSAEVAAHAPCTVTVVRPRRPGRDGERDAAEEPPEDTWTVG